eukprot:scaffold11890_cov112-Isochrysis_galbana.AAC.4
MDGPVRLSAAQRQECNASWAGDARPVGICNGKVGSDRLALARTTAGESQATLTGPSGKPSKRRAAVEQRSDVQATHTEAREPESVGCGHKGGC